MKSRIDPKTGIDTATVKFEVIDAYLKKLGLSAEGSEALRLSRLNDAMQLVPNKASKLGNCSTCRGKSHVDLVRCPFCGDSDADATVISQRSDALDPEAAVISELKQFIVKQMIADEQAAADKAAKEKPVTAPSPVAGQSSLVAVPVAARSKRAAKKSEQQAALALDDSKEETIATALDLDKSAAQIRICLSSAAKSIFDAAVLLYDVFERKLWLQRRKTDGTSMFETFTAWVLEEMPFDSKYAYQLLDLPKFFTREQVEQIGSTKLMLSLRIDEAERRRMLESGELEKMSVRDVKTAITQNPATQVRNPERAGNVLGGKTGGTTAMPSGSKVPPRNQTNSSAKGLGAVGSAGNSVAAHDTPAPPPPRTPEAIQLVTCILPTRIDFEMMQRGAKEKDQPIPAKDISGDPYGIIICANGVRLRVIVYKAQNGTLKGSLTIDGSTVSHDLGEQVEE